MEMTEQANTAPAHHHTRCRTASKSGCSLFFHSLPGTIRAAAKILCLSRTDLDMRGFAISFLTLARVAMAILA
jgi:hypothetical protein